MTDEFGILIHQAFNEGIHTAAKMVRHCANSPSSRFNMALRISPKTTLNILADAIDRVTVNPPSADQ